MTPSIGVFVANPAGGALLDRVKAGNLPRSALVAQTVDKYSDETDL
jgi:hypothetical protein